MEPINGLGRLADLMRRRSVEGAATDRSSKPKHTVATGGQEAPSVAALERRIRRKLKQLGQAGVAPATLQRVVIETMLGWEYGADEMYNEPKFAALVNRVQRHMEDEPALRTALEKVVNQLSQ